MKEIKRFFMMENMNPAGQLLDGQFLHPSIRSHGGMFVTKKLIIAVGSVDGILTAAAYMKTIGPCEVIFTQAAQVNQLKPESWREKRQLIFIDLAVDNGNNSNTKKFVEACYSAGHTIEAIIDEHDPIAWLNVIGAKKYEKLIIKPQSNSSSGNVFLSTLKGQDYDIALELCSEAELADQMIFKGAAEIVNKAIKSAIKDNERRQYLTYFFAGIEDDFTPIKNWCETWVEIEKNHKTVLAAGNIDSDIAILDARGKRVDLTTLAFKVYEEKPFMLIRHDEGLSIMTSKDVDLLNYFQNRGFSCSGFSKRVNFEYDSSENKKVIKKVKKAFFEMMT